MLKKFLIHLKTTHLQAMREQKGQSIIIFTFAFLGLIAMLGLALDLGLVYIEKIKVSRTADAAALAAVVELPFEEDAMRRAIEYIRLNGYDVGVDTEVFIRGCIANPANPATGALANYAEGGARSMTATIVVTPAGAITGFLYLPAVQNPPRSTFVIDALSYQPFFTNTAGAIVTKNQDNCSGTANNPASLFGTSNKLRVSGRANVRMNFMQFFGFTQVPVEDQALGENVTNLDVAVVFDVSGSMDFETNCFGCWTRTTTDVIASPYPGNGNKNPILPGPIISSTVCTASPTEITQGSPSYKYLVHEAELYSHDEPLQGWQFERHLPGNSYWVMQRLEVGASGYPVVSTTQRSYMRAHPYITYSQNGINNAPQLQGMSYNLECFSGPNLSGNCWSTRGAAIGQNAPDSVPWLEYDFTPKWSGDTHIWIRAQAGYSGWVQEWNGKAPANNTGANRTMYNDYNKAVFWQVGTGNIQGGTFSNLQETDYTNRSGAISANWRWLKLGSAATTQNVQTTFKLYQGSSAFMVDKIVFTNNSSGSVGSTSPPSVSVFTDNSGRGMDATQGSATREACNICSPNYGQLVAPSQCSCKKNPGDTTVGVFPGGGTGAGCTLVLTNTNQLSTDLFGDQAPLRNAQEAVKNFAMRLDPKFDQIGFVTFSTNAGTTYDKRVKLQCLRWATNHGGASGVAKCYEPSTSPISYTRVLLGLETQDNNGSTNIAEGLMEGLEELGISIPTYNEGVDSTCTKGDVTAPATSNDKHSCDRRGAARKVLVLMTDGSPNENPGCPSSFEWNGTEGAGVNDYDCAMWYALQAYNNNVTVYTIGIGAGANRDLLTAIATGKDPTKGDIYFSDGTGRGGAYYNAATPADLDAIFTKILSNVFVRIIG
jgi:Flp pilus assembly protein TadG